jgi:hypothetical protein
MLVATHIQTRPNTSVDFYYSHNNSRLNAEIQEEISNGNIISTDFGFSEDDLTITTIFHFANQEAYNEFIANPVMLENRQNRNAHNIANGIIESGTLVIV